MLVINILQVKEGYSGVGVYSVNIVNKLFRNFGEGIIYTGLDVFGKLPQNWKLVTAKITDRDLLRWLWINLVLPFKLRRNDVLFSTFTEAPLFFNGKQIITVHDLMPLSFPEKHSWKLRFYYRRVVPKLLKRAFRVIAISETTKDEILKFFPGVGKEKISVIYNGFDNGAFNTLPEAENLNSFKLRYRLNKYILYVGRISKIKNVMQIIESFSRIHDRIPHDLLIVGRDESEILPAAIEFTRKMKIESRVKFIEYLDKNEIPLAYKGAALYVNASLAEGFGLPVVEAMACGVPCILSDISAFREVSGSAACLFDPSNSGELAEKILIILSDKNLYESYKSKGLKRAEYFSWSSSAEQTAGVIASAFNSEKVL